MLSPPEVRRAKPRHTITPLLRDAAPLVMLASALFYSNRWLTLIDDETSTISAAAQNITKILAAARSSVGNAHPPLYQLLMHVWLRITGGALDWLRAPAIVCFVLGIWLLSRVARQLGGEESGNALVWLGALWPFGFHAGRLAGPYTFAFLLIAAVTWQYFRAARSARPRPHSDWIIFCVLCLALLYTDDFAWALMILIAIDYSCRVPARNATEGERIERKGKIKAVLLTASVLLIGFAPRWPVFIRELHSHLGWPSSLRFLFMNAAYNFYVLFVSQSMAPWFWRFSIPAAVGVAVLLVVVFGAIRGEARNFLIFSLLLFALMALAGILQPSRLLLVGPWLILPIGIALGTTEKWQWRLTMALALATVAAMGWYGALNKRYYADPRFLEPWSTVVQDAADALRSGSGVISNDDAFFFYLTYALRPSQSNSHWHFTGALPRQVQYLFVWDPEQWEQAGRPAPASALWIRGSSPPEEAAAMNDAGEKLSAQCGDRITRYLVRDTGYIWKQRFVPNFSGPAWRIEIRQYLCGQSAAPPPAPKTAPR
jgi:dolichyl-phosphate-mannose-protein mannosyltransferase